MTVVFISALLLLMVAGFFYLKVQVDKVLSGEEWINRIKDEMDDLVLEINRTTEQNVTLLEEQIRRVKTLLDKADKKVLLLQEVLEKASAVQQELTIRKPSIETRKTYTHLKKNQPKASADFQVFTPRPSSAPPSERAELFDYDEPGEPPNKGETPNKKEKEQNLLPNSHVMDLYGRGFAPGTIAQKLGISISEVELIINLVTGDLG